MSCVKLTLNYCNIVILGLDYVSWICIKNFQTFFGGENWDQLGLIKSILSIKTWRGNSNEFLRNKNCYHRTFIYSEKVTKFCAIFTLLLSYVVPVKSKVKLSQNFVAFSEYMNFNQFLISCFANQVSIKTNVFQYLLFDFWITKQDIKKLLKTKICNEKKRKRTKLCDGQWFCVFLKIEDEM